jgi:hemerythrin-like domain-containing protein
MLRDPSLIPLSHQHQHTLALCVRLDRALQAGAVDLASWQLEIRQHFADEVQFHFVAEEEVLFPAARRYPELGTLLEELGGEHERLREYFGSAGQGTMSQDDLAAFVKLLSGHVRKEERQLFETMQKRMRPEGLQLLGVELARALDDAVQVCRLRSAES